MPKDPRFTASTETVVLEKRPSAPAQGLSRNQKTITKNESYEVELDADSTLLSAGSGPLENIRKSQFLEEVQQIASSIPDEQRNYFLDYIRSFAPLSITERLGSLSLKERRIFLDSHYSGRVRWAEVRGTNSTPLDLKRWIDNTFPDRDQIGLVFSDLMHLDKEAYTKIVNLTRCKRGTLKPEYFGFPIKKDVNTLLLSNGQVPSATDVYVSRQKGDPRSRHLGRLYSMARGRQRRHHNPT